MLHRPLLARTALALLGLLLVTTSSLLIGGLLNVSGVFAGEEIGLGPEWQEDDRYDEFESMRRRTVVVSQEDDNLVIAWSLTTSPEDPVVAAVSAGVAFSEPTEFASEVAYVEVSRADGDRANLYAEVGPPTTEITGERALMEATAELSLDDREAVLEVVTLCFDCQVEVEIRTEDYLLVGLSVRFPFDEDGESDPVDTRSRDRTAATLSIDAFQDLTIRLDPPGSTGGTTPEPLIDFGEADTWNAAWQRFCFTLPWLFLLAVPLPRSPAGVARRTIALALSGLLLALFVTVYAELAYPLGDLLQRALDSIYSRAPFLGGSPGAPAATLLGVVWAGIALGYLVRGRPAKVLLWGYLLALLAGGALLVGLAVAKGQDARMGRFLDVANDPLLFPWLAVCLVGAVLLCAAVGWRLVPWLLWTTVAGAAAVSVAAMAGLTHASSPQAAWVAGGVTILFDAVFLATLIAVPLAIVRKQATENPPASGHRLSWPRRAVWPALFILCVWIALPQQEYEGGLAPVDPIDAFRLADATVPAARVALFVALLVYLWVLARHGWGQDGERIRMLAWAAGAVMLLRPDVLLGGVPLSFLAGVLLLRWAILKPLQQSPAGEATVRQVVAAGRRGRLLTALEGTLERKVISGDKTFEDATKEFAAARDVQRTVEGSVVIEPSHGDRGRAFGTGDPDPWRRGLIGAGVAAVAGLPGFVQALAALARAGDFEGAVPILSASSTLILVLRYPLYGFFFGYFFPLIRGDTGLAKSRTFGIVLGVSELVALLLPYQRNEDVFSALVAWSAQIFLVCFALGLAFDAWTLRRAGLGVGHLLDVHRTNRTVALSSAVAASAATALVTTLASGAVTLITSRLGGG